MSLTKKGGGGLTKQDLDNAIRPLATKKDLESLATKKDLARVERSIDAIKRHFNIDEEVENIQTVTRRTSAAAAGPIAAKPGP